MAENPKYSLQHIYKRTAFNPATFTWRTIADANFGTIGLPLKAAQRIINQTLRDNALGFPISPSNYTFKTGLWVLIPNQKALAIFRLPAGDDPTWFKAVMENDWKVFTGYEAPKSGTSVPALGYLLPLPRHRARQDPTSPTQRCLRNSRCQMGIRHSARMECSPMEV